MLPMIQRTDQNVGDSLPTGNSQEGLKVYFQPVGVLKNASVLGHQVLLADDRDKRFVRPELIQSRRASIHRKIRLEWRIATLAYRLGMRTGNSGCLFVNLSADLIVRFAAQHGIFGVYDLLRSEGVVSGTMVVNLCGYADLSTVSALIKVRNALREQGVRWAMAVPEDGRPAMLAWEKFKPDFVWLGERNIKGIDSTAHKRITMNAIRRISTELNIQLIACGISTPAEAVVLRDMGIDFGQGRLFGLPLSKPVAELLPAAVDSLNGKLL